MCNDIISAIIEASGVIIAAVIAALGARRIVKESINSRFYSYADRSHSITDLFAQSQSDIYVVAAIGIRLLENYKQYFVKLLKRGIHIRFLVLDESKLKEVDSFIHGKDVDPGYRSKVIGELIELKKEYGNLFEVK